MRKDTQTWTVADLERRHASIEFPDYQREPNVWSRAAKQRLVDSMLRQFDIASLYIYDHEDGSFDCIDGRQRIGAIMAFLGENPDDVDNEFGLNAQNEIYKEDVPPFSDLDGMSFKEIAAEAKKGGKRAASAKRLVQEIREYHLTVVRLSQSKRPEEFNLQFTRLNLGTIINSGEKLHAMVGELRDVCFGKAGLGQHAFLDAVNIPTRRYSKEQVAAQILAQVFSLKTSGDYTRTRHFDLQLLFKDHTKLDAKQKSWIQDVKKVMAVLHPVFKGKNLLNNRAMTVSVILLALKLGISSEKEANEYAKFVRDFQCRLKWQIGKGLDVDVQYRWLTDFQRHITQASVEKPAVKARESTLEEQLKFWKQTGGFTGDKEYKKATKLDPASECGKASKSANS
jgi:hypothetical protein